MNLDVSDRVSVRFEKNGMGEGWTVFFDCKKVFDTVPYMRLVKCN